MLITILMVVLFLGPYALFLGATARLVQHFSLSSAVKHVDKDIMLVLQAENEKAGDYVSAMLLVRNHQWESPSRDWDQSQPKDKTH